MSDHDTDALISMLLSTPPDHVVGPLDPMNEYFVTALMLAANDTSGERPMTDEEFLNSITNFDADNMLEVR